MKSIIKSCSYIFLIGILLYISCKKETSCESCAIKNNKPPIAVAGPDQVITLPADSVLLDGKQSSDPDGIISSYLWTKISGPSSFLIVKPTDSLTKLKTLVVGTYQFELKVTDNGGLSAKDTMTVIVDPALTTNHPPIANAGADQTIILPTNTVSLNGSGSTDPENNITSYLWTKISGLSSSNIANAVQAQVTNLAQGVYQFELKVTDAGGLFAKDTVQVIVNVQPTNACDPINRPIINAQLVTFGTLSHARTDMAVASAGNKIVFAGGYDGNEPVSTVDIYDIVTHTWSTAQLSAPRFQMAATTCGNKIFFAGGYFQNGSWAYLCKDVDIYDATTNSWSVDSLSVPRSGLTAASVGNKVFFAGGTTTNWEIDFFNTIDIYDLTTGAWSTASLSEARGYLSAVKVGNKIYFAGGKKDGSSISTRIDIYDNATSSWSIATLNEPKASMASIAFGDKIYWAGGNTSLNNIWHSSNQVEIKDVNTQTSSLSCLLNPYNWYFQPNGAVEKNNKLVFYIGYGSMTGLENDKFDLYDVANNTWSIGILNQNIKSWGAAIISVDNTIYVAGGNVNNVVSNQVWKLEF